MEGCDRTEIGNGQDGSRVAPPASPPAISSIVDGAGARPGWWTSSCMSRRVGPHGLVENVSGPQKMRAALRHRPSCAVGPGSARPAFCTLAFEDHIARRRFSRADLGGVCPIGFVLIGERKVALREITKDNRKCAGEGEIGGSAFSVIAVRRK